MIKGYKKGYKIIEFEPISTFSERMKQFNENTIECTEHTLFRLSEKQREIFKCEKLKEFLLNSTPLKVGIQKNENYAIYYEYKDKRTIKIIISFKPNKIRVITFYILDIRQIPGRLI
ncbi:MAG: hypothetical protein NT129_00415 [Candidatus Aenigmarchaeota archaeon]|nr:hypothetical protein [Candidatus Aenigmarchaeota archaeon]